MNKLSSGRSKTILEKLAGIAPPAAGDSRSLTSRATPNPVSARPVAARGSRTPPSRLIVPKIKDNQKHKAWVRQHDKNKVSKKKIDKLFQQYEDHRRGEKLRKWYRESSPKELAGGLRKGRIKNLPEGMLKTKGVVQVRPGKYKTIKSVESAKKKRRAARNIVQVPRKDPITGRRFGSEERKYQQSLPPEDRGAVEKKVPRTSRTARKAYWAGAPTGTSARKWLRSQKGPEKKRRRKPMSFERASRVSRRMTERQERKRQREGRVETYTYGKKNLPPWWEKTFGKVKG